MYSFDKQWSYYREKDRIWCKTKEELKMEIKGELNNIPLKGKSVLDVGCGAGVTTRIFMELGAKAVGLDRSEHIKKLGKNFYYGDALKLPFPSKSFDILYSKGVFHHTGDTYKAFLEAKRVVKDGGVLYVWLYSKSRGFKAFLIKIKPVIQKLRLYKPIALFLMLKKKINWKEAMVLAYDFFGCKYRDEYDENEIKQWFDDNRFKEIKVTNRVEEGFGVYGVKAN